MAIDFSERCLSLAIQLLIPLFAAFPESCEKGSLELFHSTICFKPAHE